MHSLALTHHVVQDIVMAPAGTKTLSIIVGRSGAPGLVPKPVSRPDKKCLTRNVSSNVCVGCECDELLRCRCRRFGTMVSQSSKDFLDSAVYTIYHRDLQIAIPVF